MPEGARHEPQHGPEALNAVESEARLPMTKYEQEIAWGLEVGLPAADSVVDRSISTFSRGELPHFAGINTFLKQHYLEDVRQCGDYDVAILGAPFDGGTTYRAGARFGPQGIRKISALYGPYSFELGVDLRESITMCDLGDIFVIPGNIEKTFDQVSKAVGHVLHPVLFRSSSAATTRWATPPPGRSPSAWAAATLASSTSTDTSTHRTPTSTSACTPRRGFTPPTCPTCRPRTWSRSASAAGRRRAPGSRCRGTAAQPS